MDTRWFYLLFPVVELPARGITVAQVCLGANIDGTETLGELLAFVVNLFSFLIGSLRCNTTRYDNDLDTSHPWWKDKPLVIAMDHDHDTNGPGGQTPGILPDVDLSLANRVVGILYEDIEHILIGEVCSKAVGGAALNTTTRGGDETFDGGCVKSTGKLLLLRLDAWDDRDREELLVYAAVEVEDLQDFLVCLFACKMSGVTFLPQEFSSSKEWLYGLRQPEGRCE